MLEERNQRVDNDPSARLGEQMRGRALSQPSLRPAGDRLAPRDREAQPRGRARLLQALLHAQQRDPGRRRRRHRRRGEDARRGDLRQGRAPRRDRPRAAPAGAAADRRAAPSPSPIRASTQPSLQRSYLVPSSTTAKPGEAEALDVLAHILGGGTNSRLYPRAGGRAAARGQRRRLVPGHGARRDRASASTARRRAGVTLEQLEDAIDAVIDDAARQGRRPPKSSSAPRTA